MIAVTTFGPSGYEKYGRNCLQTLDKHFPGRVIAYYEEKPTDAPERVELREFSGIPGATAYLDKIKDMDGDGHKDYRYDANRFCRKVFAQDAVFDESDRVFWIDADSVILKPIPSRFLDGLVDGVALAYLGRHTLYTETGFLGFNTKHPDFTKFRANYLSYFTTGRIFSQMKGWHDCIAFDHARKGVGGRDLNVKREQNHCLVQSVLGEYIDHLKGPKRKAAGHSKEHPATWWAKP